MVIEFNHFLLTHCRSRFTKWGNLGEATNSTQNPRPAPNSTAPNSTAPNSTAPNPTAPNSTAPNSTAPNSTAPNPKLQLRNVSLAIFAGLGVGALVMLAVVFINWKKTKGNETQNTNNTTDLEEKVSYASIRFNKNPKVQTDSDEGLPYTSISFNKKTNDKVLVKWLNVTCTSASCLQASALSVSLHNQHEVTKCGHRVSLKSPLQKHNMTEANSQETERDLDNTPKSMAANNGNQKQIIENMVEPDDVVPYTSINIIQKPNDKAKVSLSCCVCWVHDDQISFVSMVDPRATRDKTRDRDTRCNASKGLIDNSDTKQQRNEVRTYGSKLKSRASKHDHNKEFAKVAKPELQS
ncbi:hypothetical protein EXN66_Car018837 [Channa argus]|uniref:Uncharacterized protein n=1 Tax=Channa argus TaxID=215402 RepID=A0A6G1QL98_CHAAH|nr:hypothetical protein EXN66_Car018837 [Channa argus]